MLLLCLNLAYVTECSALSHCCAGKIAHCIQGKLGKNTDHIHQVCVQVQHYPSPEPAYSRGIYNRSDGRTGGHRCLEMPEYVTR